MIDVTEVENEAVEAAAQRDWDDSVTDILGKPGSYWQKLDESSRVDCRKHTRKYLLAMLTSLRARGFELVLQQPTDDMFDEAINGVVGDGPEDMFRAMLSASPKLFVEQ